MGGQLLALTLELVRELPRRLEARRVSLSLDLSLFTLSLYTLALCLDGCVCV
jgi:hypothetical protein